MKLLRTSMALVIGMAMSGSLALAGDSHGHDGHKKEGEKATYSCDCPVGIQNCICSDGTIGRSGCGKGTAAKDGHDAKHGDGASHDGGHDGGGHDGSKDHSSGDDGAHKGDKGHGGELGTGGTACTPASPAPKSMRSIMGR